MADLEIALPLDSEPERVERLTDGAGVPFEAADGTLTVHLDRLGAYEGLKIL
jgi:hypothetical protein